MSSKKRSKSSGGAGEVYNVERIVGKRIHNGIVQYNVKWEGYPESQNTWENEDNVFCADLIQEFEDSQTATSSRVTDDDLESNGSSSKSSGGSGKSTSALLIDAKTKKNTLQPGKWETLVQDIVNVERSTSNELLVVLKWKDSSTSVHPSSIVNVNCPQKMIKFYEEHLKFKEE